MPCPHYEGNNKCAFHDSSYILEVFHVLDYCVSTSSKHQSCIEFKRVHDLKSVVETEDAPSQSLPKCTQHPRLLTRDQLAQDIPDAELDSCYTRVGNRFLPK